MKIILTFLIFFMIMSSLAQNPSKIRVKRQNEMIYFYQKGIKSDTITSQKNNLFYFVLSDSLKNSTRLLLENASYVKTDNDSIIKLIFMPGLRYEVKFTNDSINNKHFKFESLINGATFFDKNQILIQVKSTLQDEPLIENKFYFKN